MRILLLLVLLTASAFGQVGLRSPAFVAELHPRPSASTWVPSDKSGLKLWYMSTNVFADGLASVPQTTNGSNVWVWGDLSGNNWHATNTAAVQPTFKTSVFGSVPGVHFTAASSQFLYVNTNFGLTVSGTDQDCSICVVFKAGLTNNTRPLLSIGGPDADTLIEAQISGSGAAYYGYKRDNAATLKAMGSPNGVAKLTANAVVWNFGPTTGETARDGVIDSSIDIDVGATTTAFPVYIGFRVYGTTQYFDGDYGAILVYDSVLTVGEIASFTAWAQAQFGTP